MRASNGSLARSSSNGRYGSGAREPLALIGIGCRFPGGAVDADTFWSLLSAGKDAISEVPPDRWNLDAFYDPDPAVPEKMHTRWGGFIEGIDKFDAHFFGISPREIVHVDPQQRLLLEVAVEALEDGGLVPEALSGSRTGVFVGISTHDYSDLQLVDPWHDPSRDILAGLYGGTGGVLSIAANRISYTFNLQGPSVAIDTACSSALVATHLAAQSIWSGECDLALAGGVNCVLSPTITVAFCKAGMLSPDGRSKAFDARANGYVRGEGAGMVVIKPLSRALRDRDLVYAVIRGTAVNQDGKTSGLTVPSLEAQQALLREVYRKSRIRPRRVRYIEAHGTGTAVGDPIEATAIGEVLGRGHAAGSPLLIGSVKTNIGHLEAASGVAGLIKAALVLKHGAVPPSLHFQEPNPKIDFAGLKLVVPSALTPLPGGEGAPVAGVNSFGFGGTNAHVILEAAPEVADATMRTSDGGRPFLVPTSARGPEALADAARSLSRFLAGRGDLSLRDVAFTAGRRRSHHEHRLAVVARSVNAVAEGLEAFLVGETRPYLASGRQSSGRAPRVAFVFSGMGPQWWAMGRQLLQQEPVFRQAIEQCDALLAKLAPWSLLAELNADEAHSRMERTEIAQPANFALQVGLAALLRSWGIEPDAIVGHSAGEVAAAHVAGALTLEDAVTVIYHRSRLQQRTAGKGRMLAAGLTANDAERELAPFRGRVSLGAINGPNSVAFSGEAHVLEELARSLEERQVFARMIAGNVPYHSHHMDELREELLHSLRGIRPRTASLPLFSVVSGGRADGSEFDASYWWRNVREPVQFTAALDALTTLDSEAETVFLELSPHPVLARDITATLAARGRTGAVLTTLRREEDERASLLSAAAALYVRGAAIDWAGVNGDGRFVRLPGYPWQKERYWHESEAAREFRLGARAHPLLGRREIGAHPTWQSQLDKANLSYLEEHALLDATLFPAAGYFEMVLAATRQVSGSLACLIEDLEIKRPLVLVDRAAVTMQLVQDLQDGTVSIYSRVSGVSPWTQNMTCRLPGEPRAPRMLSSSLPEFQARATSELSGDQVYRGFKRRGLQYGPRFQGIELAWTAEGEAVTAVRMPSALDDDVSRYCFHPALMDSCLQVVHLLDERPDGVYVPVRVGKALFLRSPAGVRLYSHARLVNKAHGEAVVELQIEDADGVIAEFRDVRVQFLSNDAGNLPEDIADCLFQFGWYAKSRPGIVARPANYLPSPAQLTSRLAPEIRELRSRLDRDSDYNVVEPRLDELARAYVIDALAALGWRLEPGQRVAADVLRGKLGIAPQFEKFLERLLAILAEGGLLRKEGTDWLVLKQAPALEKSALSEEVLALYPSHAPTLRLMANTGSSLAEVLRGELPPLELVFPAGEMTVPESLYQESPSFLIYNLLAAEAVAAAAERLPPERTLRLLEVGAGTGGTTAHLVGRLPSQRSEYVFTDISSSFNAHGQQKFRDHPFLRFATLDIENDPALQDFQPHSFDLVIAVDALHATRDLRQTLANVKKLLVSDGMLLLVEPTRRSAPLDIIFGVLSGWWRFEDYDLRPDHPLLPPSAWKALLAEAGFPEVEALTDTELPEKGLHTVFLARAPRVEEALLRQEASLRLPSEPGSWLIFADEGGVGEALAQQLDGFGESCIMVTPGDEYALLDDTHCRVRPDSRDDLLALLSYVQSEWPTCRGVLHFWNLDAVPAEASTAADRTRANLLGAVSAVMLVQALVQAGLPSAPGLWLVTRGAQAVTPGQPVALSQTPVWGLGRVIMNEHPQLSCTLVDLDPSAGKQSAELLFGELWSHDGEQEIAYRGASRYVNRLTRIPARESEPRPNVVIAEPGEIPYRVQPATPGILESLTLQEVQRRAPRAGEVEIEVHAAALNFRDVMKAMGLYPQVGEDETGGWLGDECSGRIVRVGEGVSEFREGDEVIAIAPGAFSAFVTIPTAYVVPKPPDLSFEQAASIPIVFLTAHYALNHIGRLRASEKVLIHAAAGGVGLAAVQLVRAAGAEIFATAGSAEKRAYLQSLGIQHVMDDRSLDFADQVMEATGGQGVDLVLNSLAGEFIPKSLSVLGLGGRFLELGKVDIYRNSHLAMWPFRNGLSFCAIDLASLLRERPGLVRQLLDEVMARFAAGELRPLPLQVFPVAEVAEAFRFMSQARHTGKIVLSMRGKQTPVTKASERERVIRPDATYLITGGLGGFGLAVAEWIVEQGGRHLVLVGRSGASTPDARESVRRMERQGATVRVARVDVTQEEQVAALLAEIRKTMPTLRGIVHAAMVLDDGLIVSLDRERIERVMAPKVEGAWLLHQHTLGASLDFFVNFSSFSAIAGIPGQGNYGAANAYLDAMAHYRVATGLPGLSINWGAIGEVGYVARHADLFHTFERQGILPFKTREAVKILHHLFGLQRPQVGAARADFARFASFYSQFAPASRMSHVLATESQARGETEAPKGQHGWLKGALAAAAPDEREKLLESFLRDQLAEVLGISPGKLDIHQPLASMGLDSLMAVQMETLIEVELGVKLPTGFLLSAAVSITDVARNVVSAAYPSAVAAAESRMA